MSFASMTLLFRQPAWLAAIVVLALGAGVHRSSAAILGSQYSLSIAPSERVLAAIGTAEFEQVLLEESCDNPHLRVRARNKPSVMITNGDDATAPIESFTLQINEGPYMFGDGDAASDDFTGFIRESIFYMDPDVSITGSSISADGTALTIDFSGLTAGKSVVFSVDLDANDSDMFPFPDYRTVLFGAPMSSIADPTAPGSFSALYSDGESSRAVGGDFTQQTDALVYFNGNIRPYYAVDMIEVNQDQVGGVPEPGTWALAALSLVGLAGWKRRRRDI